MGYLFENHKFYTLLFLMTNNNYPITPPPELVRDWIADWSLGDSWAQVCQNVALVAARWGADQELEACCEWTAIVGGAEALRAARRPKPPSLKEQALTQLDSLHADLKTHGLGTNTDTIRRALEQLND